MCFSWSKNNREKPSSRTWLLKRYDVFIAPPQKTICSKCLAQDFQGINIQVGMTLIIPGIGNGQHRSHFQNQIYICMHTVSHNTYIHNVHATIVNYRLTPAIQNCGKYFRLLYNSAACWILFSTCSRVVLDACLGVPICPTQCILRKFVVWEASFWLSLCVAPLCFSCPGSSVGGHRGWAWVPSLGEGGPWLYYLQFTFFLWKKSVWTSQESGQIITTSAEVTPNGGLARESPQNGLKLG